MDKKEKSELLLSAIGEIDEELIKKADFSARKFGGNYLKPLMVSAAALLITLASYGVIKQLMPTSKNNVGGDMSNNNSSLGDMSGGSSSGPTSSGVWYADGAALTLTHKSGSIYTFELIITKEQVSIEVAIRGSGYDDFGEPISVISTTADYAELTHTPTAPPKLKLNGESVTKIPTVPGEYTLTVDLTELDERYVWDDFFIVYPFGEVKR